MLTEICTPWKKIIFYYESEEKSGVFQKAWKKYILEAITVLSGNVFYPAVGAGSHRQLQSLSRFLSAGSGLQKYTEDSMESHRYRKAKIG